MKVQLRIWLASLFMLWTLAACAVPPAERPEATRAEIDGLTAEILSLGPGIDPEEAQRAAEIAFSYTRQLALEYEIVDPPLLHNTKVNMGLKPRGLCWHWAEDMERRLDAENFETLAMERAIANAENDFLIDHSTAIVTRKGDGPMDGVVLDPWRYGGTLFWDKVREDTRYNWVPRETVFARKRARAAGEPVEGFLP